MIRIDEVAVTKRRQLLQGLFKPLTRSNRVEVFLRSRAASVQLGLGQNNFGESLRAARYRSRVDVIFLDYFEKWVVLNASTDYTLEKAYLHLDSVHEGSQREKELIALDCSPMTSKNDPGFIL